MKLRPVQLVCLALLLATLRLADPAALTPVDFAARTAYLKILLRPDSHETYAEAKPNKLPLRPIPAPAVRSVRLLVALAPVARAVLSTPWSMPPPAFHSAALQSATGFGRASA